MKQHIFTGVCTALVTPFKNGEIDFEAFGKLIERQIDAGIDALCILGTTGEASTISYDEKCKIIKFSCAVVKGRVPIVFGIGGNNPPDIIKLGSIVKKLGGDAVMVTAPYYNKSTQDGAVKYFDTIANAVKLPLIAYNVPGRCGYNLEPETLARIAQNPYVVGIKEASGNISQIAEVVRLCPDVAVYSGDDGISLPAYAIGCQGVISVASNVTPKDVREIWLRYTKTPAADAAPPLQKGDLWKNRTTAQELFLQQLPFYKSLFRQVNPIPVKFELAKLGFIENELRLPLTPIED